jgi:hypothetical protein
LRQRTFNCHREANVINKPNAKWCTIVRQRAAWQSAPGCYVSKVDPCRVLHREPRVRTHTASDVRNQEKIRLNKKEAMEYAALPSRTFFVLHVKVGTIKIRSGSAKNPGIKV